MSDCAMCGGRKIDKRGTDLCPRCLGRGDEVNESQLSITPEQPL